MELINPVIPNLRIREIIKNLLALSLEQPQVEIDAIHTQIPGLTAKTIYIKAGTMLVGKVHLKAHINLMSHGDITVFTEEGLERLKGFNIMPCNPGTARVGIAHQDTVWTTFFMSDETDPQQAENSCTSATYSLLEN